MKKIAILLTLALASFSLAANRVGPVSQYGALKAGQLSNGHGRIFGSCPAYSSTPVKVRGMSLYWSVHSNGTEFYNDDAVSKMVQDMKIEIIRIPVGTDENCWSGDCAGGYINDPTAQQALVDKVVQSAVKNDIYVIIDWHSHKANNQTETDYAKSFFSYMAQQYGKLDNVIFEVFNEPIDQNWATIKDYAEKVIAEIRKHSTNLVLVGSRSYDQFPNEAISSPINDNNVAYTFHYYANTHDWSGGNGEGDHAVAAIKAGLPVFVSEWGTADADGGGSPNDYRNDQWQKWLNDYDLSAANWSASRINEGTAAFTTNSNRSNFSYTTSGTMVKGFLANNPNSYTACSGTVVSSSSAASSSASQGGNPLIDDFEDGNGIANTGLEDFWYAYTDVGNKGASTIGNTKDDDDNYIVVIPAAAAGGSDYGAGLTNISLNKGQNTNAPYVALGLDVAGGLAGCKTITYKYKGAAHSFKVVMEGDTDEDGDGASDLTGWNRHKGSKTGTTSWTTATYTVPGDLAQESGWGVNVDLDISKVVQLQWEVTSTTAANYFYIDDLKCEGMDIVPVVIPDDESSSSTKPKSSSSSAVVSSSSHVNPTCVDGDEITTPVHLVCVAGEWTEVPASSASSTDVALIDDFEDGDNVANTGAEDYWYAFTDSGNDPPGLSTISNTKSDGEYVVVFAGAAAGGSGYGMGLTGINLKDGPNFGEYDKPSVTLGFNVEGGLAGCTEISYKYKGAGHNLKTVMKGDEKGALTGYNYHKAEVAGSTGWSTASIAVSKLEQEEYWGKTATLKMANVVKLQWEVKGTASSNYLYIDDVSCTGMSITPTSSSGTVQPSSSSAVAACTEGEEIVVGASHIKCVDGQWVDVNAGGSSSSAGPAFVLVDDFEDGDNVANTGAEDYWYAFTDSGNNPPGRSTISNTKSDGDYVVVFPGAAADGSGYGLGLTGINLQDGPNFGEYDKPSVTLGFNVEGGLAGCTEISYKYKGAGHNLKTIMKGDEKGALTEYNYHKAAVDGSTSWSTAKVAVNSLKQEPYWGKTTTLKIANVVKLQWEVKGEASSDYLYVDDVKCIGMTSNSSTKPNSSSSVRPISSSGSNGSNNGNGYNNNGYNNNGYDNNYGAAIGVTVATAGLNATLQGNTLMVSVARAGLVKVQVFDMMGHTIESHSESMVAGSFAHTFGSMGKGAYIVRVQQGSAVKTLRMQVR